MRNVISFEEFYESIWLKIPEVWRNSDGDYGRPLQLLTLTLAQHFYYSFYLKIASMDELFDPDMCPDKYLPFLAATVNWKLLGTDAASWRNQIRHAPLLYKIKGTRKAITIAEKLVGYSVFMTELYRDYTGKILPKEKMFNNFPLSVKVKPWFRKTSTDISTDIFNETFSDLLPAFNVDSGDITEFGSLLIPRKLRKTNSTKMSLSTSTGYDPKTGLGSIARLAKLPRINVVLKKDLDLDYVNSDGRYTDANLNEAVDLFMQFKPFHVHVNDLVVLYSLSDYVLGADRDKTAGSGDIPGEVILYRENIDIFVTVQEQDKISYYNQEQLGSCDADSLESADTSLFKGNLETKYLQFTTQDASPIVDVNRLMSLGLPLSGYARNYQTANGDVLWLRSDFSFNDSPDFPGSPTSSILMDSTKQVRFDSVYPSPVFSFLEVPAELEYFCNLKQLLETTTDLSFNTATWPTSITNVSINTAAFCKDTVTIAGKVLSHDSAVCPETAPVSLKGITKLIEKLDAQLSGLSYKLYDSVSHTSSTIALSGASAVLELFRAVVKDNILVIATFDGESGDGIELLQPKLDYIYDTVKNTIILNSRSITEKLTSIEAITFHVLYAGIVPTKSGFSLTAASRNINIADRRKHAKFNRITYVDNSHIQTEIDTAHYSPELEFDDLTGTLVENSAKTKLYREPLQRVFSRNSLHRENTGTPYPAVSYDPKSPRDTSKWSVYTDPADNLYLGAERLSKTIWANYHNVPFTGSATTPYNEVNISGDAQLVNRQSFRWLATLNNITPTHPEFFVASRMDIESRHSLWTRGSAQKMARPYIGSSRSIIQGFRKDNALFNRTENLPDYHVSLLADYNTDNYKYTLNGLDYTDLYRNPTVPFEVTPSPSTETLVAGKTTIVNNTITYPAYISTGYASLGYTPQYEGPFDFTSRETYYGNDSYIKPSLYANNIRTDMCPYSGDLMDDFADPVELNIDGLQKNNSLFTIVSPNDRELVLPKTNIFVYWREINTGISVGTGLFPLVDYSKVRPSVKVLKNGIELAYGLWTLASNPNRVLFAKALSLMPNDIISVDYFTLDGVEIPLYPADPDTGSAYTLDNSKAYVDSISVPAGFDAADKTTLFSYTFSHRPVITWYRGDTGAYISVSADKGLVAIAPLAKLYRHLAVPNVKVRKNGIDVPYGKYWKFASIPSSGVSFRLVFLQNFVQSMQPTDSITISYTGSI